MPTRRIGRNSSSLDGSRQLCRRRAGRENIAADAADVSSNWSIRRRPLGNREHVAFARGGGLFLPMRLVNNDQDFVRARSGVDSHGSIARGRGQ